MTDKLSGYHFYSFYSLNIVFTPFIVAKIILDVDYEIRPEQSKTK